MKKILSFIINSIKDSSNASNTKIAPYSFDEREYQIYLDSVRLFQNTETQILFFLDTI